MFSVLKTHFNTCENVLFKYTDVKPEADSHCTILTRLLIQNKFLSMILFKKKI